MYEVSKCAPQEALRNLDAAFAHFFRRCKLKHEGKLTGKLGYPQLKTKKRGWAASGSPAASWSFLMRIQLPRLGRLRLKERGYLPTSGRGRQDALGDRLRAGWALVRVRPGGAGAGVSRAIAGPVVGVDLGVKTLATLSDGTVIPNPRHLKRRLKKLKRFQRAVTRKREGLQEPQEGRAAAWRGSIGRSPTSGPTRCIN